MLGAASAARTTLREPEVNGNRACRFKCLEPIIPMLQGIIDAKLACELLDLYFVEPGGSLFRCSSPYVLAHIVRKESLLRSANPRRSTPALLITMLWVSAQTAESSLFLLPGQKSRVCEELRRLMMALIQDRDPDFWHRATEGLLIKGLKLSTKAAMIPDDFDNANMYEHERPSSMASEPPPAPSVDDVLTFVLITIVVSGGDFKADCFRWWNKALSLSHKMRLNREDATQKNMSSTEYSICTGGRTSSTCACRSCEAVRTGLSIAEIQEERRRAFWLMFCLDRHLALSFNSPLRILDDECQLYAPMPDKAWESSSLPKSPITTNHDPEAVNGTQQEQHHLVRSFGAPTRVVGIGFFEYFLPLMAILGDIIQLHRRKNHPRFGNLHQSKSTSTNGVIQDNQTHEGPGCNIEGDPAYLMVEQVMAECAQSIVDLAVRYEVDALDNAGIPASQVRTPNSTGFAPNDEEQHVSNSSHSQSNVNDATNHRHDNDTTCANQHQRSTTTQRHHAQAQLVTAYSTFIINVLHVLLHGKWDAVSMLDNKDGWIPSVGFMKCASHAIAASDAVSRILACDPELSFMPYLFGIYLLHGSFILLLFADRMPQIGLNESVERACEIIIRAHEVCVVTLSTEFQVLIKPPCLQKHFRKVLRSTLYSVRSAGTSSVEESKARRRALSLYRWNNGSTGLAL
ncbi:Xylanolytic transcriptional activator xlnR [Colletotrichum gloeosporioides]|uniref:Xylanolytic transcriptional activator xlnR n=1 Tax=Colletotrichum gloeosporioides TaxID=474922 RepID=A0A8H4CBS3_COLGL|nr:Xylanolytic transcriptional activator xlnR [Colletotrichum gloeosporioides]KAF3801118.1 Xylanolytic transcriptional activator xlnR [Colletotrichum gloeosporioides]